ncbi:trypsin-1-like [Anopheles albimanus]|uniref:Peptidase S1 domain-containing protein n=1 Tax=Anopheles albimanus TaxID=7167 RepID=A0A2Y9D0J0_ANOAL|nr:trypsin-1-like [Anopheles albimanus]XP_035784321.1 trypsin-1-like [Anopheles albimanus]
MTSIGKRSTIATASVAWMLCALFAILPGAPCQAADPRIVGGFVADAASTRHQVSVRSKASDVASFGRGHICGGSLINLGTVLTAAHCLVDDRDRPRPASYFRVVGGSSTRSTQNADTFVTDVKRNVVHGNYRSYGFLNDIGLLILTKPVGANHPTLQPIPLASRVPPNGTLCQTSGWGSTSYGGPSTEQLMAVNVTIIATSMCNAPDSYGGTVGYGMLCAGNWTGGKDACQGDSGGPLVCDRVLVGVVSHGIECARPRLPGVYADVATYRDWIARNGATALPATTSIGACLLVALATFLARR